MIPTRAGDLDDLLAEVERQHHEAADLFERVSVEAALWRPDGTRWSMAGHLAHLRIVNEAYEGAIEDAIQDAIEGPPTTSSVESAGPYRHPWIARWFVRSMEPPPKRRVKTFRSMVPEPDLDPAATLRAFQDSQERLRVLVDAARGLDLGGIRFGSPFFPLLRLSLGTGLELVLAHNRRHLWLIRELMDRDDFPGGS